jgi:hypothetical protein
MDREWGFCNLLRERYVGELVMYYHVGFCGPNDTP